MTLRRAIAPLPRPDGGRDWLHFTDPVDTIVAWELDEVRSAMARIEEATQRGLWAVGMVSYDAGPAFDPALASHRADGTPLVAFGVFDSAQPDIIDRVDEPDAGAGDFRAGPWTPAVDQADFEAGVRTIQEHIATGDTYQVNLTLRLHGEFEGDPLGLFRALARSQQGEHLVFLDFGRVALCSASPELYFRSEPEPDGGRRLTTKPMKGTRARHPDPSLDAASAHALVASEKDRAENTMIVDMMRNDLGRIARVGSVEVPELHVVESYPTVHQMVSTVTAVTDASLTDVFAASFPPASITGAPKVRTSELITELEKDGRGAYCGSAGLIAPDGTAEFNVAIRSVWIDVDAGRATYGTGGGIVWDSDPTEEWQETRTKTRVLETAPAPFELFETMRYDVEGASLPGIALLDRHLERLTRSADQLGFVLDIDGIRRRLEAIDADGPRRVRLVVDPRGVFTVTIGSLDSSPVEPWLVPVDTSPLRSSDPLLRHKTTHRRVYDAARARHPEAPDVILWNERGELTETTIGNLVLDIGGELLTPELHCGLLPGTLRAELLAHDKIVEAVLPLQRLFDADAVFMINSLRGWVPLDIIDEPPSAPAVRVRSSSSSSRARPSLTANVLPTDAPHVEGGRADNERCESGPRHHFDRFDR